MKEKASIGGVIKGFLITPSFFGIPRINLILFVATFFSTYSTYQTTSSGLSYAICIMIILLAHEMGHFIMCRKYRVDATWPYFIPFPSIFGTLGAVIKMKGHIPDKRALFDIGVAGPIGGLIFAIPITIIGLNLSEIHPTQMAPIGSYKYGSPLLFSLFEWLMLGNVPEGSSLFVSPIAFAGWAGLFVTAINLFPIGQLDGGHVIYALAGKRSSTIYKIGIGIFCLYSIYLIVFFHNPVWLVFTCILLLIGFKHPPPADTSIQLDFKRKCIGVLMLIVFVLCFTPIPLTFLY